MFILRGHFRPILYIIIVLYDGSISWYVLVVLPNNESKVRTCYHSFKISKPSHDQNISPCISKTRNPRKLGLANLYDSIVMNYFIQNKNICNYSHLCTYFTYFLQYIMHVHSRN